MAQITLDIFRFDEAVDTVPHRDAVTIEIPETTTVLDALETAKAEFDGSISFRCSCRSAICGLCSMNINGVTGLACKTPCNTVMDENGVVVVDPMPNFQPMKDLVVHMDPFWDKYSRLKPYLQPADADSAHERERRVSPDDMKKLVDVANCVMCATCYALCPVSASTPPSRARRRLRTPTASSRTFATASAKSASRRSAKTTPGCARTATPARTV